MPIEPAPTEIAFPDPRDAPGDVVAVGVDFRAGTLLTAYRAGIFPWPQSPRRVGWFSPDPRAIFPLEKPFHWSRSLRRAMRAKDLTITVDEAFADVMKACGDERREGTWIVPALVEGYARLFKLGWAHSVEIWETGKNKHALVGGIYGVAIGRFFSGESMFHRRTDASKIAFAALVERLRAADYELFDVQVQNPHLESLGIVEIPRDEYLDRLEKAIARTAKPLVDAR
ncbi:MAG: leucyl/phenylalanyl-tRNA--protein transferase [Polyangiaceae bacterium]